MLKKINLPIVIMLVATVALAVYLLWDKIGALYHKATAPKAESDEDAPPELTTNTPTTTYTPKPKSIGGILPPATGNSELIPDYKNANYSTILKKGSKGNEVLILQIKMNDYLPFKKIGKIIPDGDFGKGTLAALRALTGLNEISLNKAISLVNKIK